MHHTDFLPSLPTPSGMAFPASPLYHLTHFSLLHFDVLQGTALNFQSWVTHFATTLEHLPQHQFVYSLVYFARLQLSWGQGLCFNSLYTSIWHKNIC